MIRVLLKLGYRENSMIKIVMILSALFFSADASSEDVKKVDPVAVKAKEQVKKADPVAVKAKKTEPAKPKVALVDPVAAKAKLVKPEPAKPAPYIVSVGGKTIITIHADGSMLYYDKPITNKNEMLLAFYDIVTTNDRDRSRCLQRLEVYREVFYNSKVVSDKKSKK